MASRAPINDGGSLKAPPTPRRFIQPVMALLLLPSLTPSLLVIPLLAVVGLVLTRIFIATSGWWKAWFASSLTIVSATMFGVVGLYPSLLPSNIDSAFNLTIHNSASSPLTLKIMLGVALTFVPIVIVYQAWTMKLFKEKLTDDETGYGSY